LEREILICLFFAIGPAPPTASPGAVVDLLRAAGGQPQNDEVVVFGVQCDAVTLRAFNLNVDVGPPTPPVVAPVRAGQELEVIHIARHHFS